MLSLHRYSEALKLGTFGVFIVLGCAYFFFAATEGPFGLYEKGRIEADELMLQAKRDILVVKRIETENQTRRLSDTYLDLDLLDEQARKVLGYVRSDDIILK